jgi:hypothetical protein
MDETNGFACRPTYRFLGRHRAGCRNRAVKLIQLRPTLPLKEERDAPDPTYEAYRPASALTAI